MLLNIVNNIFRIYLGIYRYITRTYNKRSEHNLPKEFHDSPYKIKTIRF